jgi:hypothetical protein
VVLTLPLMSSTACLFSDSFSVRAQDAAPSGIAFSTDGTKMFISGVVNCGCL